jgi:hypothetical protein
VYDVFEFTTVFMKASGSGSRLCGLTKCAQDGAGHFRLVARIDTFGGNGILRVSAKIAGFEKVRDGAPGDPMTSAISSRDWHDNQRSNAFLRSLAPYRACLPVRPYVYRAAANGTACGAATRFVCRKPSYPS